MNNVILGLSKWLAILGGFVLSLLIILVVASIIGRESGLGAIKGDFELVEAGMGFAIFAFLPYAHMTGAHATVDIFTNFLSERKQKILAMVTDIVFAIALIIIAWKLFDGAMSKMKSGQTSFLIGFPIWWAYITAWVASALGALVSIWHAGVTTYETVTGDSIREGEGAV